MKKTFIGTAIVALFGLGGYSLWSATMFVPSATANAVMVKQILLSDGVPEGAKGCAKRVYEPFDPMQHRLFENAPGITEQAMLVSGCAMAMLEVSEKASVSADIGLPAWMGVNRAKFIESVKAQSNTIDKLAQEKRRGLDKSSSSKSSPFDFYVHNMLLSQQVGLEMLYTELANQSTPANKKTITEHLEIAEPHSTEKLGLAEYLKRAIDSKHESAK